MKERMISRLAAMLAVMICASACGSTSAGNVTSAAETAVSETEIKTAAETVTESTETDAEITGAVSETEEQETKPVPVDLSDGITDEMYERGLLSVGDTARLCKAFMKGESGQPITIGVIGGSITQGTAASSPANAYPSVYCKWWEEKFPESEITLVNAGIGGTDSYLGVNRVDEQLLAYDPDIVIVEFSVNDTNAATNKYSYDS
ncbi:MAG: SGNH/GDSL hydrolase family protein, partial [Oscillospiraceae bacterium]|nr:SGNH/GDSL hydrolase family protein [Oscillospiraceae bacterium]